MSKEWYQSLSFEELCCLARKKGVRHIDEFSRKDLIEVLEEIQEEELTDHRQRNDIMRQKRTKFDIFRERAFDGDTEYDFEIPELYTHTQITLMLRDPFWAFAYWNINRIDLNKLKEQYSDLELFLRVYEFSNDTDSVDHVLSNFDIPIQESDTSWYINLPVPGRWYQVELLCDCMDADEKILKIVRSNLVESPGGYWLNHTDELRNNADEMELFLAGITDTSGIITDNPLVKMIIEGTQTKKDQKEYKGYSL